MHLLRRFFAPAPSPAADMSAARAKVEDLVAKHKVMVFSKSFCPFCTKGKAALAQFVGVPSEDVGVWELDSASSSECAAIQDALAEITGGRSVPRVFVGGKFIGGGDDTAAKAASGELAKLLQAAGVKTK
jgi:glutaredoxin 3